MEHGKYGLGWVHSLQNMHLSQPLSLETIIYINMGRRNDVVDVMCGMGMGIGCNTSQVSITTIEFRKHYLYLYGTTQ